MCRRDSKKNLFRIIEAWNSFSSKNFNTLKVCAKWKLSEITFWWRRKNHLDRGSIHIYEWDGWVGPLCLSPISCIFTSRVFHGAKCLNVELKLRKVMLWILDWVTLRIYDWPRNTDIQTNNELCHCDTIEYWFYLDSNYVFDATLKQSPWEYIIADRKTVYS